MALTTLANVKEALGISGTDSDALITNLIARAQAAIEHYCDRTFEQATHTDEKGDAKGTGTILVKNPPIASVTSVAVRTGASTYTTVDASVYDFTTDDSGRIESVSAWNYSYPDGGYPVGSTFGCGINSYQVTYVGGYADGSPELKAIEEIIIDMIATKYPSEASLRERARVIQSENLGYQSVTYRDIQQVFDGFKDQLDRWRRWSL